MAQKTIVQLIDDLDGGEATETVSLGLDGVEYTIDLSAENAERLRAVCAPFAANGRRIGGRKAGGVRSAAVQQSSAYPRRGREETAAIRDWARSKGHDVSDRGRIPLRIVADFEAAHAAS